MNEEWRPVIGYEGLYEASDLGNIRSVKRTQPTVNHGEKVGNHKLTNETVIQIRQRFSDGTTQKQLAQELGNHI